MTSRRSFFRKLFGGIAAALATPFIAKKVGRKPAYETLPFEVVFVDAPLIVGDELYMAWTLAERAEYDREWERFNQKHGITSDRVENYSWTVGDDQTSENTNA